MSDELFPELPGLEWELTKTPIFNTKIMTSVNGRELRASYQAVPKYNISMSFAFLRESKGRKELQTLENFFIERRGAFDSFLLKMPEDNEYEYTLTSDGEATVYQIYKSTNLNIPLSHTQETYLGDVDPNMWNRVVQKTMWDVSENLMWSKGTAFISKDGKIELSEPLPPDVEVSIKGVFYYRCRFKDDEQQYTNFMHKLWKASKVELVGSLGKKI